MRVQNKKKEQAYLSWGKAWNCDDLVTLRTGVTRPAVQMAILWSHHWEMLHSDMADYPIRELGFVASCLAHDGLHVPSGQKERAGQ